MRVLAFAINDLHDLLGFVALVTALAKLPARNHSRNVRLECSFPRQQNAKFYIDSNVALGCICNEIRFYVDVEDRVLGIRKTTYVAVTVCCKRVL